ncbi:MAG: hypothetical protein WBC47_04055 [Dehalococcoidia bacterium]
MFAKEPERVKAMSDKNGESCPKLYECPRIRMTPIIRALLRCSADEAMKSICASCDENPKVQKVSRREKVLVEKSS